MTRFRLPRSYRILAAASLAAALLALPATASEAEPGWQIRLYAAAISMDDDASGNRYVDLDVGAGLGFNAEYRFTPRLGIDLGILSGAAIDIETVGPWPGTGWVSHDAVTFTPLTAGLDIHLTPDARVDLYACPMVALVHYGGLAVRNGPGGVRTHWDFDQDLAVGATLGLGVPFAHNRWSFQSSLTYLESSLDGSSNSGLRLDRSYDSTIFGFGFGYRFGRGPA